MNSRNNVVGCRMVNSLLLLAISLIFTGYIYHQASIRSNIPSDSSFYDYGNMGTSNLRFLNNSLSPLDNSFNLLKSSLSSLLTSKDIDDSSSITELQSNTILQQHGPTAILLMTKSFMHRINEALDFIYSITKTTSATRDGSPPVISWDKIAIAEVHILKKINKYISRIVQESELSTGAEKLALFVNKGLQCSSVQQQQQVAISKTIQMDICSEIEWYKLVQLAWPEAKTIVDVGGNKGYLGSLFLALWGGGGFGLYPAHLFDISNRLKLWQGSRNPAGYCRDGYNKGIQLHCPHHFTRNISTGVCSERRKEISIHSFDGSSFLAETLNEVLSKEMTDPLLRSKSAWQYHHNAVSDKLGTVRFTKQGKGKNAGFEGGHIRLDDTDNTEAVNMTTIDIFLKNEGITKLDILKIDAEGNDNKVIAGAMNAIKTSVGLLTFEGGKGVSFSKEMLIQLDELGFSCYSTSRAGLFKWTGNCMPDEYLGGFSAHDKGNIFCVSRRVAPMATLAFDALSFPVMISELYGDGSSNSNSVEMSVISKSYVNIKAFCSPWPTCIRNPL